MGNCRSQSWGRVAEKRLRRCHTSSHNPPLINNKWISHAAQHSWENNPALYSEVEWTRRPNNELLPFLTCLSLWLALEPCYAVLQLQTSKSGWSFKDFFDSVGSHFMWLLKQIHFQAFTLIPLIPLGNFSPPLVTNPATQWWLYNFKNKQCGERRQSLFAK